MADHLVRLFWISLFAAAIVAYESTSTGVQWVASGWLLLVGLLFSLANWATIVRALYSKQRGVSFVPLVGAVLVAAGLFLLPHAEARSYAWGAPLVDPWLLLLLGSAAVRLFRRRRSGTGPGSTSDDSS